jgi:hypothetical protein
MRRHPARPNASSPLQASTPWPRPRSRPTTLPPRPISSPLRRTAAAAAGAAVAFFLLSGRWRWWGWWCWCWWSWLGWRWRCWWSTLPGRCWLRGAGGGGLVWRWWRSWCRCRARAFGAGVVWVSCLLAAGAVLVGGAAGAAGAGGAVGAGVGVGAGWLVGLRLVLVLLRWCWKPCCPWAGSAGTPVGAFFLAECAAPRDSVPGGGRRLLRGFESPGCGRWWARRRWVSR